MSVHRFKARAFLGALLFVVLAFSRAHAAGAGVSPPKTRTAILSLSLRGIPEDQAYRYGDILAAELRRLGFDVIDERETLRLLEQLGVPQNCIVGPCLKQVGTALGVQKVVVANVVAQGSSYDVNLTFVDTSTGSPLAQAVGRCDVCTADEGLRAFARVTASLATPQEGRQHGQSGTSPIVWRQDMARPWYKETHWRIVGFSLGLASFATGTALLVLDGSCTDGKRCPRTFEFTVPGVTLIGVGVLLSSATALTYFINAKPSEHPRRVQVSMFPGGIGVRGHF